MQLHQTNPLEPEIDAGGAERSLGDVLQEIDAYDENATNHRVRATNLPQQITAILAPHLDPYRSRFDNLLSPTRGFVKCAGHLGTKLKNSIDYKEIKMKNPSRCPSCDAENSLCIQKEFGKRPIIMPLPAHQRTGRARDELQYWMKTKE